MGEFVVVAPEATKNHTSLLLVLEDEDGVAVEDASSHIDRLTLNTLLSQFPSNVESRQWLSLA
jgi:hypothetical protein